MKKNEIRIIKETKKKKNTEKRMKKKNEAKFKKQSKNETLLTNGRKKIGRRVI